MLIDSHCHIHDPQFYPEDRESVYGRAIESGVKMIVIGTSESDSREAVSYAATHEEVWAVVGVHPHDTKDGWQDIGQLLSEKPIRLVGIGEIGLDYFYNNSPRDVQIQGLEQQLQWAQDYNLPVSFHVREAFSDFWPIFDNFSGIRGVLHSFTDTAQTLERALGRGLFIGVNGISLFTRDAAQQTMYDSIPLNRLLFETDAPFLTPPPYRGKVNEPAMVRVIADYHAVRRNIPKDEIAHAATVNTMSLFAL